MLYMDGRMSKPATKYARITEGPVSAAAIPGSRKNPELNMAPVLMAYTSYRVRLFSSVESEAINTDATKRERRSKHFIHGNVAPIVERGGTQPVAGAFLYIRTS
jgi:hypothetical protein